MNVVVRSSVSDATRCWISAKFSIQKSTGNAPKNAVIICEANNLRSKYFFFCGYLLKKRTEIILSMFYSLQIRVRLKKFVIVFSVFICYNKINLSITKKTFIWLKNSRIFWNKGWVKNDSARYLFENPMLIQTVCPAPSSRYATLREPTFPCGDGLC